MFRPTTVVISREIATPKGCTKNEKNRADFHREKAAGLRERNSIILTLRYVWKKMLIFSTNWQSNLGLQNSDCEKNRP